MKTRHYQFGGMGTKEAMRRYYSSLVVQLTRLKMSSRKEKDKLVLNDSENGTDIHLYHPEERKGVYWGPKIEISGEDDNSIRKTLGKLERALPFCITQLPDDAELLAGATDE